jgi:4-carboxymuconolactone decarboxylase
MTHETPAVPRFPRLSAETMTPRQREVAAQIAASPRGEVRGPFLALIHHPDLAQRLQQLGEQLRWGAKLPAKLVELAVLVTARRWTCQHEWYIHVQLARKAGLQDAVIQAIADGFAPKGMSLEESTVHAFCTEAHASGRVSDATFAEARERFGLDGALELLALCGYYSLMAMVLNTAGFPLPDNASPPLAPL